MIITAVSFFGRRLFFIPLSFTADFQHIIAKNTPKGNYDMKRFIPVFLLVSAVLFSCSAECVNHLPSENESMTECTTDMCPYTEKAYKPINFGYMKGEWIPYTEYPDLIYGKSEDEFRLAFRQRLEKAVENGANTVFLHVHPNGDSYYRSEIYPKGKFWDGEYDVFQIMLDEAHSLGLSVHGWINPFRLQSTDDFDSIPDEFITKQWFLSDRNIGEVNGKMYLRPDSQETNELLKNTVAEIITEYDVDGIHIDDYFYPTTDPEFDSTAFAESGSDNLAEWRMTNISKIVKAIYDTVKCGDKRLLFGISPQGNINSDYTMQYADVKLWLREKGYADYIIPQIYFGFEHESCPFMQTLEMWEDLPRNEDVRLIIGLGAYKLGKNDIWAGKTAETEWTEHSDIIERQIKAVENSDADGYAIYY